MARILVIDDEPGICRAFEKYLGGAGHEVRTSSRAETGLTLAEAFEPDLVVLDVRLPGMSGLAALTKLRERDAGLPVIVVTAFGTMETAVQAMKLGAYDYILKPLELDRMREVIDRALKNKEIAGDVAIGGAVSESAREDPFAPLLGRTPAMQEVYKKIGAVATADVCVLVEGESGTGKELVARAIHYASPRRERPFEPLNCAAIPEAMLDVEIHGHAADASSPSAAGRVGRLERAEGGALFLDEVSELPSAVQVRLLRLLEEGSYERLGGTERHAVDVRVLAATNVDLRAAIEAGRFREDLYYRLNVMSIRLPALRDRAPDIPVLAAHFLAARGGKAVAKDAVRLLLTYAWPGNVRELRNAIEHALVLARGGTILPEHLPEHVRAGSEKRPEEDDAMIRGLLDRALDELAQTGEAHARIMERFEAPLLELAMERTKGNQVKAAQILGIHRTTLRSKLQKLGD